MVQYIVQDACRLNVLDIFHDSKCCCYMYIILNSHMNAKTETLRAMTLTIKPSWNGLYAPVCRFSLHPLQDLYSRPVDQGQQQHSERGILTTNHHQCNMGKTTRKLPIHMWQIPLLRPTYHCETTINLHARVRLGKNWQKTQILKSTYIMERESSLIHPFSY